MATTPYQYGRFIGRVGALAVGLGIGQRNRHASPPQSAVRAQTVTLRTDATPENGGHGGVAIDRDPHTYKPCDHLATGRPARASPWLWCPRWEPRAVNSAKRLPPPTTTSAVAAQTVAASPLGTPEQLAAEQRAAETVNTLPVQLMKLVLQFGWRATAQQQFELVGGPDQANVDALDEAVDEYAMGAAFQQQLLNPMTPTAVMQVAPPHTWYGQDVIRPGARWRTAYGDRERAVR